MRNVPSFVVSCLLLSLLACASGSFPPDASARPGSDLPDRFLVRDGEDTREARAGEGCRNPLVDSSNGTEIRLVRSVEGRGDYEPAAGEYGVSADELIRVDCATGRPIGIVER